MAPKDVLDLDARRRIVDHVQAHPGLHLRGIADALGMPVSTLEYHCYQLHRHGHLSTRDEGGYKAFYPAKGIDRRDKDVLYIVRQEVPRRICSHLLLHPGNTPKQVREISGVSAPTLSFHLKKMRMAGILREEPAGRTKRLFIVDPERVANVLVSYRGSFVDDVVDRFTAAWAELRPPTVVRQDQEGDGEVPQVDAVRSVEDLMLDETSTLDETRPPPPEGRQNPAEATSATAAAPEATARTRSGTPPRAIGRTRSGSVRARAWKAMTVFCRRLSPLRADAARAS